ncbi:MAG: FG-GAP repeat protein [Candidatus Saganbacteria bacterium]|nr:FG-GAP repeat protein [Candidatus Saganbacteria bacterium]
MSSVSPEVDATNIQPGTAISVVFSEAMDSSTITTDTFTVTSASGAVSGTVSYDGSNKTATYTPTINLGYSTEDTTALTSSIKDSNGKTLTAYSSSFTTTTQAQVSSVSPAASSTDVETNTTLQITFSKAMDESTITTDNIKLSSQYGNVSGTISYDSSNKTTTFTPGGRIANSVTFTATASAGIKDSDGNSIGSDYSWTFTSKAYSASVLYQYDGGSGDSLGYVSSAGDVNSDGKSDFIIGASKTDPGGKTNAGSAYLYSGADGSLIYQKDGENANDSYGVTSDGGKDVNADGIPDFIIGSLGINNGTGRAYVYSGADGALLFTKDGQAAKDYFGRVLILGDLNNDGYAEFGAAAPYADPGGVSAAGSAYVYSGKDGTLLYQKDGEAASDMLGNENDSLEDLNGDNVPDYIVGASGADPGGISAAGSAYVYSGADASLIYRKDGSVVNQRFGTYLSSAGDVNADGSGDFMIGDSNINTGIKGTVMLYSGKDGSLLYQKSGTEDYEFFGRALASAGDVNGDGFDDFLIGAMNPDWSGSAYIYSGKDGSLLFQKDGAIGDLLGISISSAGDVNGDGKPDFIIGAYGVDNYTGVAYVYVSE